MSNANGSVKKLKSLMRDRVIPYADMDKHFKELTGVNDRVAAIVGGSIIEVGVEGLLRRFLRPGSKEDDAALFAGTGPISTFSNKTRVAYAMGLLSSDQNRHINYIREIRNAFAHGTRPLRFKTPEIEAVCKLFTIAPPRGLLKSWQHPRKRYLAMVLEIGTELANMGNPSPHGVDVYSMSLGKPAKAELVVGSVKPVKLVLPINDVKTITRRHPVSGPVREGVLNAHLTKEEGLAIYSGIRKIANDLGWTLPT